MTGLTYFGVRSLGFEPKGTALTSIALLTIAATYKESTDKTGFDAGDLAAGMLGGIVVIVPLVALEF